MIFKGLSIWGIIISTSWVDVAPVTTVPTTTRVTEDSMPPDIQLSGNLHFKRDFEILGNYTSISYQNEQPVYERYQNGISNGIDIYLYYYHGKWIIAPYADFDPYSKTELGLLWKESSGLIRFLFLLH